MGIIFSCPALEQMADLYYRIIQISDICQLLELLSYSALPWGIGLWYMEREASSLCFIRQAKRCISN